MSALNTTSHTAYTTNAPTHTPNTTTTQLDDIKTEPLAQSTVHPISNSIATDDKPFTQRADTRAYLWASFSKQEMERQLEDLCTQNTTLVAEAFSNDRPLNNQERLKSKYLQWQIDRLEDALYGPDIDRFEHATDRMVAFGKTLSEFRKETEKRYSSTPRNTKPKHRSKKRPKRR